jgi:hypothetical protein
MSSWSDATPKGTNMPSTYTWTDSPGGKGTNCRVINNNVTEYDVSKNGKKTDAVFTIYLDRITNCYNPMIHIGESGNLYTSTKRLFPTLVGCQKWCEDTYEKYFKNVSSEE